MNNNLKYRILEYKNSNPVPYIKLATICQVTETCMRDWAFLKENDPKSIPSDKLRIIARHFGKSMEEMYTKSELITA